MFNVYYLAYAGRSGTLYLDGQTRKANFKYDKLPKGSSTFKVIKLDRTIPVAQQIQWDGKYIAILSESPSVNGVIYQTKGANVVGTTYLTDECAGFFIQGIRVICLDPLNGIIDIDKYPAGGSPVKPIPYGPLIQPNDVVVSG